MTTLTDNPTVGVSVFGSGLSLYRQRVVKQCPPNLDGTLSSLRTSSYQGFGLRSGRSWWLFLVSRRRESEVVRQSEAEWLYKKVS